jgi:DNA-binding transcriptional MerR regulator
MQGFTKKDVFEIIGLPLRNIQYYTERNLVIPEHDLGEGKGKIRKYGKKNLIEFGVIKVLTDYGMAFAQIKFFLGLLDFAREYKHEDAYLAIFKVQSGSGFVGQWCRDLELDSHYTKVAESILIINMKKIISKIEDL